MLRKLNFRWMMYHHRCVIVRRLHWSSNLVRSTFIEFFKNHNHQYIRSSPVVPWKDATLAFVNAGMNQFKPVFLGHSLRPCPRATNSQKCIRVGGKHNDLHDVGRDTYHHTFFEMLGNWSFGDYFKKDACTMAWTLLTEVYKLPPDRLYVTYFGGDPALSLGPDLEVLDIWKSIGVPENRILPFGMRDNFWEMGLQGPCGPCTEIHYDRLGRISAPDRVNLGVEDMIELWNIVFMQHERLKDGTLQPLSTHHVDTGMGLERVTAVLNNKTSNYDTDLFLPIFESIKKMSGKAAYGGKFSEDGLCLDTAYRVLADHMRMTTVSLADGLFPEDSYKLRRVMRRAICIGRDTFGFVPHHNNLVNLTNIVAETLGDTYPELWSQLERVQVIFQQEEEHFQETMDKISKEWSSMLLENPQLKVFSDVISPGLLSGLQEVIPQIKEWKDKDSIFPDDVALKLMEAYGVDIDAVGELASLYNLCIDLESIQFSFENAKTQKKVSEQQKWETSKLYSSASLLSESTFQNLPSTDDSAKYSYESVNGSYSFIPLETTVISLINEGKLVHSVPNKKIIGVVLNSTNFYHEAGGQEGDIGELVSGDLLINVKYVEKVGHIIVHWGTLEYGELFIGKKLMASVNAEFRLGCMRHHTATHLLNSAIRAVIGVSSQRSSHVTHDHLSLGVRMYHVMNYKNIYEAENIVKMWVSEKCPVIRKSLPLNELLQEQGVTFLPGEVYPDEVHVITTDLNTNFNLGGREMSHVLSKEPCCGTHLLNTGDIGNFCITDVKASGVGLRTIRAVCGENAAVAEANAEVAVSQLEKWELKVQSEITGNNPKRIANTAKDLLAWRNTFESQPLPYLVRSKMNSTLDDLARLMRNALRGDANKQMAVEMEEILREQPHGPVIHLLETDFGTSKAMLIKASKFCKQRPLLVLAKAEGTVVARATLTQVEVNNGASAADWLTCVQNILGGIVKAPRGQDSQLVCNFRGDLMNPVDMEKLKDAISESRIYIEKYL
ncbi:alanine--tRNA ligase, mitochondrial isoform X2 [Palaemon carinicauda]